MNDRNRNKIPSIRYAPLAYALILALASGAAYADTKSSKTYLPDIQVSGQQYPIAITQSSAGTKSDTPIIETPQSISVVGQRELQMRAVDNVDQALKYTPGFVDDYSESSWTTYRIRGFDTIEMNRDGLQQFGYYAARPETYGAERIELLKGASSVLYGQLPPGGMVNYIGKRPTEMPLREIKASIGNFDYKQIAGDFSGPITDDGAWSYRLTGLLRRSDTQVNYEPDDRDYLLASLKWQPSEMTSLTLLAEYIKNKNGYGPEVMPVGIHTPLPNGEYLPRSFFLGEPDYSKMNYDSSIVGYSFQHAFNSQLSIQQEVRYFHNGPVSLRYIRKGAKLSPEGEMSRYSSERDYNGSTWAIDTNLKYLWGNDKIKHTTLLGIDYRRTSRDEHRYEREVSPLNIFKPVYGQYTLGPKQLAYATYQHWHQLGLYLQDQVKINDRWVILAGGRYDKADRSSLNHQTGRKQTLYDISGTFSGRLGLVYLFDNGFAPYASFSQSFEPSRGTDRHGNAFEPTRGDQFEIGIRYQPPGSDTLLSVALYNLERRNDQYPDPEDFDYEIQVGKTRSRGIELEAKTAIGEDTYLTAGYAYTDVRITETGPIVPPWLKDKRETNVPYHQFSLWADYRLTAFRLPNVIVGMGLRFEKGATNGDNAYSPTRTLLDAVIAYEKDPWNIALNASNLTDSDALLRSFDSYQYGEPRKIKLTATYRW